MLQTPAGADAMRRSTSGVSTQTARMHCGVPVFALRAPAQAVTPHHHYFTPARHAKGRYRPIQRRCHRAGAYRNTPHTHSDIMFVRQPSHPPPSPRAIRAQCAIPRSRNGQGDAHSEQWHGQVRRVPQRPTLRKAGTARVGAHPAPQRSSAAVTTRRHYTGHSLPSSCPQAGRRPLGARRAGTGAA